MLILNISEEREKVKRRCLFCKKTIHKTPEPINRYSITVNGKTVLVLELTEKLLESEDVIKLLKVYKGRVLISEKDKSRDFIKAYLFNPKEYYQRAILSSLINQMKTVSKDWKNICIILDDFSPFKEFYEIVKISKRVNLVTKQNPNVIKFINNCYYEFGAVVTVKGECVSQNDVCIDLDKVDDGGKLMLNVKGRDFILYPDSTYFEKSEEYQKLIPFEIAHNIICAAFSNK